MANTGSTLLALVTGAAIGAGIGLLYAPDKGEKTRKKLKKDALDASFCSKKDTFLNTNIVSFMKSFMFCGTTLFNVLLK